VAFIRPSSGLHPAFILALVTGIGPPDSIMPAVNRIAGMLCGSGFSSAFALFSSTREEAVCITSDSAHDKVGSHRAECFQSFSCSAEY
jgi:hypothetical protein